MTNTSDLIAHQVIRELAGLTKSFKRVPERKFFAEITLALAYPEFLMKRGRRSQSMIWTCSFDSEKWANLSEGEGQSLFCSSFESKPGMLICVFTQTL